MKRMIALSLVAFMATVAPALAEPVQKTELIGPDGKSVDGMVLHYDFSSAWLIDNQNILWRDNSRTYYLVTLKEACEPLDIRGRSLSFHPETSWRLMETHSYEIRPEAGAPCNVARIERMNDERGAATRISAKWRIW